MTMRPTRWAILVAAIAAVVVPTSALAMTGGSSSNPRACTTVGGVGTSSATADVPATKTASRYVMTATADNVANQPYPQTITPTATGPLTGDLSLSMNPASYNDNSVGGVIQMWDSLNHVTRAF